MDETPTKTGEPLPKKAKRHLLLAIILLIIGFLILATGATFAYYNNTTSSDGFTYSIIYHVNTPSYAFTAYMNQFQGGTFSFLGAENIGQLKFIAKNLNPGKELFIGYATTRESESPTELRVHDPHLLYLAYQSLLRRNRHHHHHTGRDRCTRSIASDADVLENHRSILACLKHSPDD